MIRIDEIYYNTFLPVVKKLPYHSIHWFDPFGSTDFEDLCSQPSISSGLSSRFQLTANYDCRRLLFWDQEPLHKELVDITLPNTSASMGYLNIPAVVSKTSSYTLSTVDVGKYVEVGNSGSITVPTNTFSQGDAATIYNNTSNSITITCSGPTTYISGTNTVKTSMNLQSRGMVTLLFTSATFCVASGAVA